MKKYQSKKLKYVTLSLQDIGEAV